MLFYLKALSQMLCLGIIKNKFQKCSIGVYCDPPNCLTTKNVYKDGQVFDAQIPLATSKIVDWWFLEQLSESTGAIYTDSDLKEWDSVINEIYKYDIRYSKIENPITLTYKQSFLTNQNKKLLYNSLSYNDQPGNSNSAHSKGYFIWNEEGGVHVIHSVPKSPENRNNPLFNYNPKDVKSQHAQHSICITLSKKELHIIPKYMIYSNLVIQTINTVFVDKVRVSTLYGKSAAIKTQVDKLKSGVIDLEIISGKLGDVPTFKALDNLLKTHIFKINTNQPDLWNGEKLYLNKWSQLASAILNKDITSSEKKGEIGVHYNKIYDDANKGSYYIQTSNKNLYKAYKERLTQTFKKEVKFFMVWDYIESFKEDGFVSMFHTQTKVDTSKNEILPRVDDVSVSYRFETPWAPCIYVNSGHDHSKISYQFNNGESRGGKMCFGDLNWQAAQEKRGGGAFCTDQLGYLSEYFYRRVGLIRYPINDRFLVKSSIRLNSLAGQQLDLTILSKRFPNDFKKLLAGRKGIDFEIKVKGKNDDNFYHFNPYIVIYNEDSHIPLLSNIRYNDGYDSVYIPLLTTIKSTTTPNLYKSELFDFNVFPSIKGKVILCVDRNQETCTFEKSKSYQIYKDLFVESKLTVILKKISGREELIVNVDNTLSPGNAIKPLPIPTELLEELNTVSLVEKIYKKLKLKISIKLIKVPASQIGKLVFPENNDENYKSCLVPNSEIIKYNPNYEDHLIYCTVITQSKELEGIKNKRDFVNKLGAFAKRFAIVNNGKWKYSKDW
ncbi:hypothetical protein ACTA71_011304 [Dictyostelium dimigraforme]